jgi:hypothetical protein
MEDITFLSDDEKIEKLVDDVKHKFSVFSVSNTLFPKNKISDSELKSFFEKILYRTNKILNAPTGIFTKIVNGQLQQTTYNVVVLQSSTLDDLSKSIITYLEDIEVIGFYDLRNDVSTNKYSIRLYKFEDTLKAKAKVREDKINDILKYNIDYF